MNFAVYVGVVLRPSPDFLAGLVRRPLTRHRPSRTAGRCSRSRRRIPPRCHRPELSKIAAATQKAPRLAAQLFQRARNENVGSAAWQGLPEGRIPTLQYRRRGFIPIWPNSIGKRFPARRTRSPIRRCRRRRSKSCVAFWSASESAPTRTALRSNSSAKSPTRYGSPPERKA